MLYVNDELVSTRNKSPNYVFADIVKDYHETLQRIRDYYGEFLNVETKVRPRIDSKTRALRHPGPRGLLLETTVTRELPDGTHSTENMRYSPVLLRKDENGSLRHENPNLLIHKGVYSFSINGNPDLAYYVYRCGKVGKTPAEGKKFHLFDAKDINSKNAKSRRMQGQVLNLIYTSLSDDKLRTLAKSFGVANVDTKDQETVREELFDKLQTAEDENRRNPNASSRGFKEFVESSEVKMHDKVTALCIDARDAESLVYNMEERRWEINYKDGGSPYILKELGGSEFGDPLGSLVNYLLSESSALRKLEGVMGLAKAEAPADPRVNAEDDKTKTIGFTIEDIMKEHNVPKLKKMLKELDPDLDVKQNAKLQWVREELLKRIPEE